MPLRKLLEYLDERGIKYSVVRHSPAYTAQEVAAAARVPGRELAKTVMVKLDGRMVMAVVPAPDHIHLGRLAAAAGARRAELASESEFGEIFPDCEVGAMPPFGNLWQVPVYLSEALTEQPHIAFNAGSHTELMILSLRDFVGLAEPKIIAF
jgi:Ala-tRNA(Pro) deacylase